MYLTYLDSNSWLIEMGGKRILLDPWLVGPLMFGNLPWLFKGERRVPRQIPENIDLILLSQGLEDHAHPPTLEQLDRQIPVVGSVSAAKVVQGLNYTQVTALKPGETFTLADVVEIRAVPGSPVGPGAIENGYILKDLSTDRTLYYEPHGYHDRSLSALAPIDAIITPIIDLEIPLIGPIIKGKNAAIEVSRQLQAQTIVPTAAGGDIEFTGLLISLLRAKGSVEELNAELAQQNLNTRAIDPIPGERFEVAV